MDIKSKNSHKLEKILIALIILLPSITLTALYPKMGEVYSQKVDEYEAQNAQSADEPISYENEYYLSENFINYAVEASYYLYGQMLQEASKAPVDFRVLDEYGWINDYYSVNEGSQIYAEFLEDGQAVLTKTNSDLSLKVLLSQAFIQENAADNSQVIVDVQDNVTQTEDNGADKALEQDEKTEEIPMTEEVPVAEENTEEITEEIQVLEEEPVTEEAVVDFVASLEEEKYIGYMVLQYDAYGNLSNVSYQSLTKYDTANRNVHLYEQASQSFEQYRNNVDYFNETAEIQADATQIQPKNFQVVFLVEAASDFSCVNYITYDDTYWFTAADVYFNMGAEWVVMAFAVCVALAALILPFFKRIDAGKGRCSNLSFEGSIIVGTTSLCGALGMFSLMIYSSRRWITDNMPESGYLDVVGISFSPADIYVASLMIAFLGWSLVFAMEYFCLVSFRKFFESPKNYVRDKVICVRPFRWCMRCCNRCFLWFADVRLDKKAHGFVLKFVSVQTLILFFCCLFGNSVVGVMVTGVYAVLLYVLMRKFMEKICNQYEAVLNVTKQMAEGDLKVELHDKLGPFQELGDDLCRIKEGFSKAVYEEAKSQNMKTELITNVSHDLKTPLTAIITYVDLLKKPDITEEERADYIDTLERKSLRLKILIEDLFEVSKATTNNITMNYADVDIVNLVKQVKVENEDKIAASDLEFVWNLPQDKWVISLDPNRTYRVIDNLLQNALKYSMKQSRVYVDMTEDEEYVNFTMKNMSAVAMNFDANEITERFVRGDLSRNTEGSGLGLAIARSFTELQNGRFEIQIDGDLFKVMVYFKK